MLMYMAYLSFQHMRVITKHGRFRKKRDVLQRIREQMLGEHLKYNMVRLPIIGLMAFSLMSILDERYLALVVVVVIGMSVLSHPVAYMFGHKTLYKTINDYIENERRLGLDKELLEIAIMLRSLADSEIGRSFSVPVVFNLILLNAKKTRSVWANYMLLYPDRSVAEANKYFTEAINTELAAGLVATISKLKRLKIEAFKSELDLQIAKKTSANIAKRRVADMNLSALYYFTALLLLFLISYNFMYMLFMENLQQLNLNF